MTPDQTAKVVARIQAGDNRTVDRTTVAHWHEAIGHLEYQDALQAVVNHFRETADYLMPAHVIAGARRIREERAEKEHHAQINGEVENPAPAPHNMAEMMAAWNDPVQFAREVAIYNQQLAEAGLPPVEQRRWAA
ncbi:hypothetical protein [Diaminobutyricimonas sp. LJ205]|uniref:hypothetical protein n=1 Tax=Diaminobutyricimonas sp. LJ205 TaxID=2683590 RepID=UPI0012F485A9|nr:hypothetical protein [Diaminobutyricimonas sp. LJ205]